MRIKVEFLSVFTDCIYDYNIAAYLLRLIFWDPLRLKMQTEFAFIWQYCAQYESSNNGPPRLK